ncbi:putative protein YqgN [Planctomycetes bacterium LzC2]|uniref:5-formyltetrahydrofolate cyclo-ligase n=2 Tax=Alienimonas chondri TaxID=2681879 RepID=A0ABX1VDV8_9PLAN|nr:putative protein YqgN [Alienimonas chondri]
MDKAEIRSEAFRRRKAQADKDEVSARIFDRVFDLPEYQQARIVLFYVDARSEVRTKAALPKALADGKTVLVPWCNEDGRLELFRLTDMSELELGMYDILEPAPRLRRRPDRVALGADLDFALVPGVAFDDRGGRVGHGKGYYDKLLEGVRSDCPLVAPVFECQLFDEVPTDAHDVFMDFLVTEDRILEGFGRGA